MLTATKFSQNDNYGFFSRLVFSRERPEIIRYSARLIDRLAGMRSDEERTSFLKNETLKYCRKEIPAYKNLARGGKWSDLGILEKPVFWKDPERFCNTSFPYDFFITTGGTISGGGKFVQRCDLEFFLWDHYRSRIQTRREKKVLAIRLLDHFHGLRVIERSGGHETRLQAPFQIGPHVKMLAQFLVNDRDLDSYDEIVFRGYPEYSRTLLCYLEENGLKYRRKPKVVVEIGRKISRYWQDRAKRVFGPAAETRETYGISEFPMSNSPVEADGGVRMPPNMLPELADFNGNIITAPFVKGQFIFSHLVPFTLRQPLLRYTTGDCGYFDEAGRIFFQGRQSQIIYEDGVRSFGWMDMKKALDGTPGLYYPAEGFSKYSRGIIKDRTVVPPQVDFSMKGSKTVVSISLADMSPAARQRAITRAEDDIEREIRLKGLPPSEVSRTMQVKFVKGKPFA